MRSFHRAEFLKVLEDHVPSHYRKHFNKRLTSYEDSAQQPVLLHFKDGTTAQCDVLIGADGIKSAVRRSMFAQLTEKKGVAPQTYRWCMDATWSGLVAYRGLVPTDTLKAQCPNHTGLTSPVYVSASAPTCSHESPLTNQRSILGRTRLVHTIYFYPVQ